MQDKPAPLLVKHEPPLGWLVLNRPEVQNAIDLRTWNLIVEGMAELEADSEVRAIVMRSSTPEAFSSGAEFIHAREVNTTIATVSAKNNGPVQPCSMASVRSLNSTRIPPSTP